MSRKLWAVANATNSSASLISVEHPEDNCPIPIGVTHTGGSDNNFIYIPNCSDSTYWENHHITVTADDGSWTVSFWVNDDREYEFFWSSSNAYSEAHPVPESTGDETDNCAILITFEKGLPVVSWTRWR